MIHSVIMMIIWFALGLLHTFGYEKQSKFSRIVFIWMSVAMIFIYALERALP